MCVCVLKKWQIKTVYEPNARKSFLLVERKDINGCSVESEERGVTEEVVAVGIGLSH